MPFSVSECTCRCTCGAQAKEQDSDRIILLASEIAMAEYAGDILRGERLTNELSQVIASALDNPKVSQGEVDIWLDLGVRTALQVQEFGRSKGQ